MCTVCFLTLATSSVMGRPLERTGVTLLGPAEGRGSTLSRQEVDRGREWETGGRRRKKKGREDEGRG